MATEKMQVLILKRLVDAEKAIGIDELSSTLTASKKMVRQVLAMMVKEGTVRHVVEYDTWEITSAGSDALKAENPSTDEALKVWIFHTSGDGVMTPVLIGPEKGQFTWTEMIQEMVMNNARLAAAARFTAKKVEPDPVVEMAKEIANQVEGIMEGLKTLGGVVKSFRGSVGAVEFIIRMEAKK